MKLETIAVHGGRRPDPATGAVREPLHLTTTFERAADGSYPHGHSYARTSTPNRSALEQALAMLEGGADAIVFASGSAATLAAFSLATASAALPGTRVGRAELERGARAITRVKRATSLRSMSCWPKRWA